MPSLSVRDYYDAEGEEEWRRLEKDAYHRLELLTHLHFLDKFLPPDGRVLDAGGGPGRYAIALARRGFHVTLLDLSPVQLGIARRKAVEAGVPRGAIEFVEGALPDLTRFAGASFDAVLSFSALSHLVERPERDAAVAELVRVARKGAPLFVSVINRFGVYRTILQRPDLHTDLVNPEQRPLFSTGVHRGHGSGRFPAAYFFTPEELRETMERHGVRTLALAGCEGLAAHLQEPLTAIAADAGMWDRWLDIHWETCTQPSVIGAAEHVLYVGRSHDG